jgi:hypothetical protein
MLVAARLCNGDSLERIEDCGMRRVIKKSSKGGCRSRGGCAYLTNGNFFKPDGAATAVSRGPMAVW